MKFTKMHGIGNDFIVVNALEETIEAERYEQTSRTLCDRKFGVGADGLILVLPSATGDYRMRMFNPDGSEAEMCGNGVRCFAKYVFDHGLSRASQLTVETLAGVLTLDLIVESGQVVSVRVDMGEPRLAPAQIPVCADGSGPVLGLPLEAEGRIFHVTTVSMGNPHAVVFEDDLDGYPVARFGRAIETHPLFPQKINVHFVRIISPDEVVMKTWERGAGETLACGTGACAVAVASALNGHTRRDVLVHLPGGDLRILWRDDNRVLMTGPAEEVFTGTIGG